MEGQKFLLFFIHRPVGVLNQSYVNNSNLIIISCLLLVRSAALMETQRQ